MHDQRGVTLIELVIVVALASIVMLAAIVYGTPWLGRESMRSAVADTSSFVQLTRMESVSRNRDCRFVVDTGQGRLTVWDGMGTISTSDDTLLHSALVPASVVFSRPDAGSAVTLAATGDPGVYETVFASSGWVTSGSGAVFLHGGDGYRAVRVHAAGASEIARWNGSGWVDGP